MGEDNLHSGRLRRAPSKRPYKEPWSLERTADYMKELRGKAFDSNVLDLFLESLGEVMEIRERYRDE